MARKLKKYNVGLKSEAYAISMVEHPAIEEDFVALASQEEEQVFLSSDEKHIVYGAVLVPDKEIYRNNEKHGEYFLNFSNEAIEKMSQDFFKEYRQFEVKTDHKDIANEVCVVESWLKSDMYKDKSVALGLNPNLPIGTWFCGMKVNNIDTWNRIKNGELKGFSVESVLALEEAFEEQINDNNMEIETNEMFWTKLKNVLKEAFSKTADEPNEIEPTNINLEEQTPAVEQPKVEEPKAEEPKVETPVVETPKAEEPKVEEPKVEEAPKVEEPKNDNAHLEELIGNLKAEIEALKSMNEGLQDRIKEIGKQPSTQPVNPIAKPNSKDTYAAWREQMRSMIG